MAFEEDSDVPFTGDFSELVTENKLKETTTYNKAKLKHFHLYDTKGTQIKNIESFSNLNLKDNQP